MNKEAQDKNSKFDNSEIASDIQVNSPIPYQNNKGSKTICWNIGKLIYISIIFKFFKSFLNNIS